MCRGKHRNRTSHVFQVDSSLICIVIAKREYIHDCQRSLRWEAEDVVVVIKYSWYFACIVLKRVQCHIVYTV